MDSEDFKIKVSELNPKNLRLGEIVQMIIKSERALSAHSLSRHLEINDANDPEIISIIDSLQKRQELLYEELNRREQKYRNGN